MFEGLTERGFQIEIHSHAEAILGVDFAGAVDDIESALANVSIPIEEIIGSGGGETQGTQRLRRALAELSWFKFNFVVEKRINGKTREAISHEIDHVKSFEKGVVALEIEWNNKDPFFDRDLENFKRLHADGAISVGIIVTRGESLQDEMRDLVLRFAQRENFTRHADVEAYGLTRTNRQKAAVDKRIAASGSTFAEAWAALFVADKFGQATTHWSKLAERVRRGVGNPCPLVLIGLPSSVVTFNEDLGLEDIVAAEEGLMADGIVASDADV